MPSCPPLSRRELLQLGAASCMTVTSTAAACAGGGAPIANTSPLLAPDFTVASAIPDAAFYIHDPGMVILPDKRIFVAAPIRYRPEVAAERGHMMPSVQLARSDDSGQTWTNLPPLPGFRDATPLAHQGDLYLIIPDYDTRRILVVRSSDGGESWSKPSTVSRRPLWNCQTSMATRAGCLYWALTSYPAGNSLACVRADLRGDLLAPQTWQISSGCDLPRIPGELKPADDPAAGPRTRRSWAADTWLEPNVVNVNGHLRALLRIVTANFSTTSLAAVCDIHDDGGDLEIDFHQFHPLPGAQCKFFILWDAPSQLFWMLSNIPTDSQDQYGRVMEWTQAGFVAGPGNERRMLVLHYSLDALNWFPAGIAAMWPSPLQAFMYPVAAVDGDDLVFISRSSRRAPNQHDADVVTFHRIRNFRTLAVDLRPSSMSVAGAPDSG